jgi:hypothetical protein
MLFVLWLERGISLVLETTQRSNGRTKPSWETGRRFWLRQPRSYEEEKRELKNEEDLLQEKGKKTTQSSEMRPHRPARLYDTRLPHTVLLCVPH